MSDNFAAVGSAIYARMGTVVYTYRTDGTATTTGTLGTYDTQAPQGGTPPYVIFQRMAGEDEYKFGAQHGESLDFMLKAVSNRLHANQHAYAIYATAHANLQDAVLSVTGNTLLRCRRRSTFAPYRDTSGYWHVGGLYMVDLWRT